MNIEVKPLKTAAELALASTFAAVKGKLPGNGPVAALRDSAFRDFDARGLPHRRVEEWKYTDLRAFMRDAKPLAAPPEAAAKARAKAAPCPIGDVECRRIVFINGAFVPELSDLGALEKGLTIGSMAAALAKGDPLVMQHLGKIVETDSGLDIDALRIVADGVNRLRSPERSMIVITHYQRLLDYIVPDVVHVMSKGRVVKTGGKELALELEARGYAQYQDEAAA
jgi:Fe-S cluster assembly protein SufD